MVSPSVHQIRIEFREKKPKGPHSGSIYDSEGPCGRVAVIRPSHRDFVGMLELAAKMEAWRPEFGVPLES